MDRSERRCLLYVDLEAARAPVEAAGSTLPAFAARVLSFARAHGRVLAALAYGDVDGDDAREVRRAGCDVRLTSEEGEGSAPESIALALDAAEALVAGPHVDAVVLVTDDAQLVELVRRLRRHGRYVALVAPASFTEGEPARSADRTVTIEALLAGEVEADLPPAAPAPPERVVPRETRETQTRETRETREPREIRAPKEPRDTREPRPRAPVAQTLDLEQYDWSRLVLLLRDLEAKMPFVGMRWLKNKVIGPHNVGAVSIADKQLLLNRAVDEGLLETYRVGNRDEAGDPVTACRLVRDNERVKAILAAAPALPAPAEATTEGE